MPKSKFKRSIKISFQMSPEEQRLLKNSARQMGMTEASLIRNAIYKLIASEKK